MKRMNGHDAFDEALIEEMKRDKNVVYYGEDVTGYFYHPKVLEAVGEEQIFNAPIAEALIGETAVGMAIMGMRPVADMNMNDFFAISANAVINDAAKVRFWSCGTASCPVVFTGMQGVAGGMGSTHTQIPTGWFANVPGVKIVLPSTPADMKGLLKTAIRDNDPVIFLRHNTLDYIEGNVPEGEYTIPFGQARIAREGTDVTVVCWQIAYKYAMELAEELAEEGISLEVIDPRTICPLDMKTIKQSVLKTGRLVIAHEEPYKFGPGTEMICELMEAGIELKAPPIRACTPMTAIPALSLEWQAVVNKPQIKNAIYKVMGKTE